MSLTYSFVKSDLYFALAIGGDKTEVASEYTFANKLHFAIIQT